MSHENKGLCLVLPFSQTHMTPYQLGNVSCLKCSLSVVKPPPLAAYSYLCYYLWRPECSDYRVLCWSLLLVGPGLFFLSQLYLGQMAGMCCRTPNSFLTEMFIITFCHMSLRKPCFFQKCTVAIDYFFFFFLRRSLMEVHVRTADFLINSLCWCKNSPDDSLMSSQLVTDCPVSGVQHSLVGELLQNQMKYFQ